MRKKGEIYIYDVIKEKRQGLLTKIVKGFLFVLSCLYRIIIAFRNFAYDRCWFYQYAPPAPVVIFVVTIVLGGSGKTPVTLLLANAFYEMDNLAIFSRGY